MNPHGSRARHLKEDAFEGGHASGSNGGGAFARSAEGTPRSQIATPKGGRMTTIPMVAPGVVCRSCKGGDRQRAGLPREGPPRHGTCARRGSGGRRRSGAGSDAGGAAGRAPGAPERCRVPLGEAGGREGSGVPGPAAGDPRGARRHELGVAKWHWEDSNFRPHAYQEEPRPPPTHQAVSALTRTGRTRACRW
jgi:hypothetical protein